MPLPLGVDRTLVALAQRAGVPALAEQAVALEAHALRGDALLAAARHTERVLHHPSRGARVTVLPPLNPLSPPAVAPRLTQPRRAR